MLLTKCFVRQLLEHVLEALWEVCTRLVRANCTPVALATPHSVVGSPEAAHNIPSVGSGRVFLRRGRLTVKMQSHQNVNIPNTRII